MRRDIGDYLTLPEAAAVRIVALLAAHALHKVEDEVDVVALVGTPQVLAEVAARTCMCDSEQNATI